ncbi:MAG: hypothetical protein IPL78_08840 [Chloroflexi bacterium]|nr:hypothetical protein [Chloroflexota bacterium]
MKEHSRVVNSSVIRHDSDILYRIERISPLPEVIVHLSDSYLYTLHDYHSKPSMLKAGDFILIARPEAKFTEEAIRIAARDKIGIGKIGGLLSALHRKDMRT